MSAVQVRVLPAGTYGSTDAVARGLATVLFLGCLLLVVFSATFPLDFAAPPGGIGRAVRTQFDWIWLQHDPGNIDRGQNVLFFVPFGFALAGIVRPRRNQSLWRLLIALPASAALSTAVEISQTLVSFRDPSVQDVWCNTLGGVIGSVLFVLTGDRALRSVAASLLRLRPLARPAIVGGALVLYGLFHLAAPVLLMRQPGDLSVWDTGMALTVGNDAEGNRPWRGKVWDVVLADRAASAEEASALARGAEPGDVLGNALLGYYHFGDGANAGQCRDRVGKLQDLKWMGKERSSQDRGDPGDSDGADGAVLLYPEHWLSTGTAIAAANYRIRQSSQLTLAVTAASMLSDQHGPRRIVSISGRARSFNLALGQEDADLTVRLRTAIRTSPDMHLRNLFADQQKHHILVTHKQAQIVIYVDGLEHGRVEITPEAKVIWRLYPRDWFRLRIEKYGFRAYAAVYRVLVFVPFAALLGATLALSGLPTRHKRAVAIGAIVVMALALEIVLGTESASGFQVKNLAISLVVGIATIGALAWWRKWNAN
jgi:hypothetical protein